MEPRIESFLEKYPLYRGRKISIGNSGSFCELDKFYVEMDYGHVLVVDEPEILHPGLKTPIPLTQEEKDSIAEYNKKVVNLAKLFYESKNKYKLFSEFD